MGSDNIKKGKGYVGWGREGEGGRDSGKNCFLLQFGFTDFHFKVNFN